MWKMHSLTNRGPTSRFRSEATSGTTINTFYVMISSTKQTTILKLLEVPFENWLYHWRIPDQVKHLDTEVRIGQEFGNFGNGRTEFILR